MKLKKGDIVAVITGKDKATKGTYKTGEILQVFPDENKVLVKGINIVTKHYRPSNARPNGGIEKKEAPIDASNVAYLDPVQKKPTRLRYEYEKDANGEFVLNKNGKKIKYRVAVLSGTRIDK